MNELKITIDDRRARETLARAPGLVTRHVDEHLGRGAGEVAREAKLRAPKLFSTLTKTIHASRVGPMHWRVVVSANYARAVEEGTGPAAGKKRYYPNPESLRQYIEQAPSMRRHKWSRGKRKLEQQRLDIWLRSRALAWHIYNRGTKAQPFMAPALAAKRSRLFELVGQGVAAAAAEIGGVA